MLQSIAPMRPREPVPETASRSPVYGYLNRPSMVDFPGRMAAVFFTSGCNFRCGFCHNYATLATRRLGLTWDALDHACAAFREQWVEAAVVSGGEPTLWPELPQVVDRLAHHGLAVKLDTNGTHPEAVERLLPRLGYVAMDIKCSLDRYGSLVHAANPEAVRRSVRLLLRNEVDYEFRTTVLESVHTAPEVAAMAELIRGARRLVLQPFLPREDLPDAALRTAPRTSVAHLRQVAEWLRPHVQELVLRGA
jgi:pyruvate formate lyase activating enzyme